MKVSRPELDAALLAFVRGGNGLVLGAPGVGKTHTLKALVSTLDEQRVPYLFVVVEDLGDATEEDLRRALGYGEGTFVDQLQPLFRLAAGVVVFDGFDAARNADVRARVLQVIRAALRNAPQEWSIIVSVRNFDAAKSPSLIESFAGEKGKPPERFRDRNVRARHFAVPELTDDEVGQAVVQIPGLQRIYSQAGEGLRRLARTPFNLWLIERVMGAALHPEQLSTLVSETQLLGLYWDSHVSATPQSAQRIQLLERATRKMVNDRMISCAIADVYSPELEPAWLGLLSAEVLSEIGAGRSRAAFTHNILFDYAVSILAIDEAQGALSRFLTIDPSRPLFLRPSLVYYFTRLWQQERERFWASFWEVVGASDVPVRLVGRLIPPYVITSECRDASELAPLLARRAQRPEDGVPAVLRVLQALRFVEPPVLAPWVEFGASAAKMPDVAFAWELASFLSRVAEDARVSGRPRELVGSAARDLFEWAWSRRRGEGGDWYDAFASLRAFPLVIATFDTNVALSSAVLRSTIKLLREPNFPIRYFNAIADGVQHVTGHAPDLVAEVYEALFAHEEESDAKTHMGGIVLALLSNRRQDFSMVQYTLAKAFPGFLRAAPEHALPAAFRILNRFALTHVRSYLREGKTVDDVTERFVFLGAERSYVRDLSASWRQVLRGEEKDIGEDVTRFLRDPGTAIDAERAVVVAAQHAAAASTWATLLEAGAEQPLTYATALFELATARPIQLGPDTLQPLGAFVEAAVPYWTKEQRRAFEESVLALPRHDGAGQVSGDRDEAYKMRVRDRLLARIPLELVLTAPARARLEELASSNALPSNDPLVQYSFTSGSYGIAEWLEDQGVNPQASENAPLLALADELRRFAEAWTNKRPDAGSAAASVPLLTRSFETLAPLDALARGSAGAKSVDVPGDVRVPPAGDPSPVPSGTGDDRRGTPRPDPKVVEQVWVQLAAAACAVARSRPDSTGSSFRIVKDILVRAAAFPPPLVSPDADEAFTSPGWSPSARTEAIQGLGYLAEVSDERTVVDAFSAFAQSPDPVERYLAVRHAVSLAARWRDDLWRILEGRGASERNAVVLTTVLDALRRAGGASEDRGVALARSIISEWTAGSPMRCEGSSDLLRQMAGWVCHLACSRQDSWARDLMSRAVANLLGSFKLAEALVHEGARRVTPLALVDPKAEDAARRSATWLVDAIEGLRLRVTAVRADSSAASAEQREEELSRVHRLINALVMEIHRNRHAVRVAEEGADARRAAPASRSAKLESPAFRAYYDVVLPLLRAILRFSDAPAGAGGMVAGTAHSFMQLLNEFLPFDPATVVDMAASVAVAGRATSYQLDPVAVGEVVKLVEVLLVDHRDQISGGKPLDDTLRLLDVFADVGWPEALRLVWRLDEVFR